MPIARGFVLPTDAFADGAGNFYVVDEYGNTVDRIASGGVITVLARIPLADDLAVDRDGSLAARRSGGA